MVDKVKPLKQEAPSGGGSETDPFPSATDHTEDYLACKGIAFENRDDTLLEIQAGEIGYKDAVQGTFKKLNEISLQASAARYTIVLQNNGSVSGNAFIGYDSLIPGDTTPVIIPVSSLLKGFAFANQVLLPDFTLEFRKNTTTGTPIHSVTKLNTQYFAETIPDITFNAGDRIFIKYIDIGDNAADVGITLFLQATGL